MAFPVFSGLAYTYVESAEKFYLCTSLDFVRRITYCLIKRYRFQAKKEVEGIKLLKELYHFLRIVSINLWVMWETARTAWDKKWSKHFQGSSLLGANFPQCITALPGPFSHTASVVTSSPLGVAFITPVFLVSHDAHILSYSCWLYISSYAIVCSGAKFTP